MVNNEQTVAGNPVLGALADQIHHHFLQLSTGEKSCYTILMQTLISSKVLKLGSPQIAKNAADHIGINGRKWRKLRLRLRIGFSHVAIELTKRGLILQGAQIFIPSYGAG